MRWENTVWGLAAALALCVTSLHAQAQNQDSQSGAPVSPPVDSGSSNGSGRRPPIGAARGVSSAVDPEPYDPAQVAPDTNTLSGAELFGLGSLDHVHTVFDPMISFSQLGQSTPDATGQWSLEPASIVNGSLAFDRNWSRYRTTIFYLGGESFNDNGTALLGANSSHASFQNLIFSQEIAWERWHLTLRDDFMDSVGASFTGTNMGGPGLVAQFSAILGATLNSIGQSFIPAETIQTGNAKRYRNAVLGQAEYSFSRRTAFTLSGSYGLLVFPDAGYVSSHMVNVQGGYDYLLDPRNSIAILGSYGKIDYSFTGPTTSTSDYMVAFAYGRKITGRLAFQVAAGPQHIHSGNANGPFSLWYTSVNSALSYDRRRSGLTFLYTRGLGAGAGVFLGDTTNTFSGSAHYQFTRYWTGAATGGYALNRSLAQAGQPNATFNNWFVGANIGRALGQHAQINFNYGLQRQSNPSNCPVASCGTPGFQHTIGMTVNWHILPLG